MKKIVLLIALLAVSSAIAQPTLTVSVAEADVTHNSIIIIDQLVTNVAGQSRIEYGSVPTALDNYFPWGDRDSGTSSLEKMIIGLTGTKVFYREVFLSGNDSVVTSINEVQLKTASVLYLKVENLPAKNIAESSATLRALVKCNESFDSYFEYDQTQALLNPTLFVTKGPGIDTVEINVSGLAKNVTIYYRANALSGVTVVSAPTIASFVTVATIDTTVSSIKELGRQEFKIFPNPITDKVNIIGKGIFELYDAAGRKVTTVPVVERTELLCGNLQPGVYLYRFIIEEGNAVTGKLLVR